MSPWKVIFATMVIFVCGVVTGALVIKTQGWHGPPSSFGGGFSPGIPGPAPVRDFMRRLQSQLDLSTNQLVQIEKIMQRSQATNAAIRKTIAPLLTKEVDRAHGEINQLLTPEQQVKYAGLLKEREMHPESRRGGGEGGYRQRNTDRIPTNGLPEESHNRNGRRGQNSNLSNPSTNVFTNAP